MSGRLVALLIALVGCRQTDDGVVISDRKFQSSGFIASGGRLYALSLDGVRWMSRDGGEVTQATEFTGGNVCDQGTLAFAVTDAAVVWAWSSAEFDPASSACLETITTVERVPVDGSPPGILATLPGVPVAIVADSTRVVVAESDQLMRIPGEGGNAELLLDGLHPLALVLDEGALFVKDSLARAILRVDPDTGAASTVTLLGNEDYSDSLLVDGKAVYWIDGTKIRRAPRDGGEATVIATREADFSAVVLDRDRLLLSRPDGTGSLWQLATDGSDEPFEISAYGGGGLAVDPDFLFVGTVDHQILRFDRDADLPVGAPGDPNEYHPPFL